MEVRQSRFTPDGDVGIHGDSKSAGEPLKVLVPLEAGFRAAWLVVRRPNQIAGWSQTLRAFPKPQTRPPNPKYLARIWR